MSINPDIIRKSAQQTTAGQFQSSLQNGMMSAHQRPHHQPRSQGADWSPWAGWNDPGHWPRSEYQREPREAQSHYHQDAHGMTSSQQYAHHQTRMQESEWPPWPRWNGPDDPDGPIKQGCTASAPTPIHQLRHAAQREPQEARWSGWNDPTDETAHPIESMRSQSSHWTRPMERKA